ncbi:isochorismatase [Mycolicibacterium moriokaense]|jgi:nicotinamidase-related amidase|uniref:Isochorismatase n=1 Tax=Mycolicibacterium moriokaense TaxID=39691 RepID=A0AAD1HBR5_9MYCO|nr:isochorismatase family cysteine hydrolase [Mycolicibacterium moriokaense]MCV7039848.1 cysteine hydrolase [Mycolicibacterium moriokaense]ORB25694.1 isochorismatase [Mycolicibacterium moriokaense]BBX01704.1 isochorismatase [Mycolicibacterium moriokaense]
MSQAALLVIDMLNTYQHEDADVLAKNVAGIVDPLAALISRARDRDDIDVIYVNDNYGDFSADFEEIADAALNGARPDLVTPIAPDKDSLRVLKVRHSAFYASSLDYLLGRLEPEQLIITGQVTEQCILYSALDAYVRHYSFVVPPDCVAHIDPELGDAALTMMHKNMHAEITPAEKCLG